MKTKKDKFEPVGAERMTDAELSKQLGSYQRAESIGMLLGILLVIAGCIMMFVYRNIAVICILVFAGVALFLLMAKPAQTKKKALMQQQLGSFFRKMCRRDSAGSRRGSSPRTTADTMASRSFCICPSFRVLGGSTVRQFSPF